MATNKTKVKPRERQKLPLKTVTLVLTEVDYRCAVPTCRGILALDMHHLWEVSGGGGDEPAIYAYKAMLVAIGRAFDVEAIDSLFFLSMLPKDYLVLSGDGVLHFSRLIAAGLVAVEQKANNAWQLVTYAVNISDKGRMPIHAWQQGDRTAIANALGRPLPEQTDASA